MSILSTLDDLILRSVSHPPLTTKGSELTYAEWDAHVTALYDAVQSIVSGVNVTAYDAGTTYDMYDTDIRNRYASYDSRIWQAAYVGSPSTFSGQTPEEGIYWTQVTLSEMLPNILELARFAENLRATNSPCPTYCKSLTIASADVLTLNSVPIEIVATPGVGYAIEVISVSMKIVYVSVAYATNTTLQLITSGAGIAQMQGNLLGATVSKVGRLATINTPTAGTTQIIENAALNVTVATGDPIAGDSDITVYVLYRIIPV